MRERRFHVDSLDDPVVRLSSEEHHHLLRVLRLRVGDAVALFDGRGRAAAGTIKRLDDDVADVEVRAALPSRESCLRIHLAVAPPGGDRMSFVVQKATELGAIEIVPLTSERGDRDAASLSRRLARWRKIALESCKQSGRSLVPKIADPVSFAELVSSHSKTDSIWVAQPGEAPPAIPDAIDDITICVGPEGGWTEEELKLARDRGTRLFGMGPRTLRTETAAISAVALFQSLAGDLADRSG